MMERTNYFQENLQESGSFRRIEKKYLMTGQQYRAFMEACGDRFSPDGFGEQTICSLYFDTPDYALIRASMEKPQPFYKEKFRIRSYGIPDADDTVFLELKRKIQGTVVKRRASMTYYDAKRYLSGSWKPEFEDLILKEIDWFLGRYSLNPSMLIAYERSAFAAEDGSGLRLTVDQNIRARTEHRIDMGDGGRFLFREPHVLAEIKVPGAMPIWLSRCFSELGVFHKRFSKYGSFYQQLTDRGSMYV